MNVKQVQHGVNYSADAIRELQTKRDRNREKQVLVTNELDFYWYRFRCNGDLFHFIFPFIIAQKGPKFSPYVSVLASGFGGLRASWFGVFWPSKKSALRWRLRYFSHVFIPKLRIVPDPWSDFFKATTVCTRPILRASDFSTNFARTLALTSFLA